MWGAADMARDSVDWTNSVSSFWLDWLIVMPHSDGLSSSRLDWDADSIIWSPLSYDLGA